MRLFLHDFIVRPSCFHCSFRKGKSGADYTLGEYWGIQETYPAFFDDDGVSLLLARRKEVPAFIGQHCEMMPVDYQAALRHNICLERDWPENPQEGLFYFLHDRIGLGLKRSFDLSMQERKAVAANYHPRKRTQGKEMP